MNKLEVIVEKFSLSKERIHELYGKIALLPESVINQSESEMCTEMFRELEIVEQNEKDFICYLIFSYIHVN